VIVLVDALELKNLDFNEFQSVLDDMSMAVTKHHPNLTRFLDVRSTSTPAPRRRCRR
jgi:hypothetical protein